MGKCEEKYENTGILAALTARNNVAHAYNQAIALDIIHGTKDQYYGMFAMLKEKLALQG